MRPATEIQSTTTANHSETSAAHIEHPAAPIEPSANPIESSANPTEPTPSTNRIGSFAELSRQMRSAGHRVRVAVACPSDGHTLEVIRRAIGEGIVDFTLVAVGEAAAFTESSGFTDCAATRILTAPDAKSACQQAVAEVRGGRADVLMKGTVNTDVLLRAVLDKERGLLSRGSVLAHVAIAQVPGLDRLVAFTDAAVIPQPTLEQLEAMVCYATQTMRSVVGTDRPRVALTHCTEQTSDKFPVTLSYAALKQQAAEGRWPGTVVDGPMDLKTALDAESGAIKGIASPVVGHADIIVFPDIEAGNTFYKTLTLLRPDTIVAGMLCGTTAPVVVTSRADSAESKYYSLLAAAAKAMTPTPALPKGGS